jgi:hypothetical protein
MTREQWEEVYRSAWETYYAIEHVETVLRRAMATGTSPGKTLFFIVWFKGCINIEKIHPLEGGFLRLKFRRDRRPNLPLQPIWLFYPKYLAETAWKLIRWVALYTRLRLIYKKIKRDPRRYQYRDAALEPVADDKIETGELFQSAVAQAYVHRVQRLEEIRRGRAV